MWVVVGVVVALASGLVGRLMDGQWVDWWVRVACGVVVGVLRGEVVSLVDGLVGI